MITETSTLRIDSASISSSEASALLRRRTYSFMQRKGDRMMIYEFGDSENGTLFDPDGNFPQRTIDKEELKKLVLEVIKDSGADDKKPKIRRRTESQETFTEYQWYSIPGKDFVYKLAQEVKEGAVTSGWSFLERVKRGPLVTSSLLLPRGKR